MQRPKKSTLTDHELVTRFQAGETSAFGLIVNRYNTELTNFIFSKTKDRDLAKDIVQDTYLKAMEALQKNSYEETGTLKPWLIMIAMNTFINIYRRQHKFPTFSLEHGNNINDTEISVLNSIKFSEDILLEEDEEYDIQFLLDKLPPYLKEILVLRMFEEMKYEELADYLNVPLGTIKTQIHVGMKRLRRYMQEYYHVECKTVA